MKTVVIVQARVGSTRLPRKVLLQLGGQTVLRRVVQRLQRCREIEEVVIATSSHSADDAIVDEGQRCGARVVRGSESDVLARYHHAAKVSGATEIVRVTSDCPLIDPFLIDRLVVQYRQRLALGDTLDYFANTHPRTFPRGLDAELFTMEALDIAHREAIERYEREHVTPYFYLYPDRFRRANFAQSVDQSSLRWTLDEPADLLFFEAIFRHSQVGRFMGTDDVLKLLQRHPELARINAQVHQKTLKAA